MAMAASSVVAGALSDDFDPASSAQSSQVHALGRRPNQCVRDTEGASRRLLLRNSTPLRCPVASVVGVVAKGHDGGVGCRLADSPLRRHCCANVKQQVLDFVESGGPLPPGIEAASLSRWQGWNQSRGSPLAAAISSMPTRDPGHSSIGGSLYPFVATSLSSSGTLSLSDRRIHVAPIVRKYPTPDRPWSIFARL